MAATTESVDPMSQICVEEVPVARLPEAWALASLEDGSLYRVDGAALVWLYEREAEFAAERLGDRYTAVRVSTS